MNYHFTPGAIYELDRDIRATLERAEQTPNCAKCKTLVANAVVDDSGSRFHRCCIKQEA